MIGGKWTAPAHRAEIAHRDAVESAGSICVAEELGMEEANPDAESMASAWGRTIQLGRSSGNPVHAQAGEVSPSFLIELALVDLLSVLSALMVRGKAIRRAS